MKIFSKLFKMLFILTLTVVSIGFILLTIKNHAEKEVELVSLKSTYNFKENFYFVGTVSMKGNALVIKANVDDFIYKQMLNETGGLRKHNITYTEKETLLVMPARFLSTKELDKGYEFVYAMDSIDYNRYELNEKVILAMLIKRNLENVIPKTAMVPAENLGDKPRCYVYVVEPKDTIFGTVNVIRQKSALIKYSGREFISISFEDYLDESGPIYIVNNIDITLKDGMRVRIREK